MEIIRVGEVRLNSFGLVIMIEYCLLIIIVVLLYQYFYGNNNNDDVKTNIEYVSDDNVKITTEDIELTIYNKKNSTSILVKKGDIKLMYKKGEKSVFPIDPEDKKSLLVTTVNFTNTGNDSHYIIINNPAIESVVDYSFSIDESSGKTIDPSTRIQRLEQFKKEFASSGKELFQYQGETYVKTVVFYADSKGITPLVFLPKKFSLN